MSRRALSWLVSLALLAALLWLVDPRPALAHLADASPGPVLAAVGLALVDRVLMFAKWYALLRVQPVEIPWWPALRAYLASGFAGVLLPAPLAGDVVRSVVLGRGRGRSAEVGASVVLERLLGVLASGVLVLAALVLAAAAGVGLGAGSGPGWLLAGSVLFLVAAGGAIAASLATQLADRTIAAAGRLFPRRAAQLGTRVAGALRAYRGRPGLLGSVLVLTLLEQLVPVAVLALIARALGDPVPLLALAVTVPLSAAAGRLPISVHGLGVGDGAFVLLLGRFGVPGPTALALAVAARLVELASQLPGALLWRDLARELRRGRARPPAPATPPGTAPGDPARIAPPSTGVP